MPQIAFAPSVAALMRVPIPFGSIGQISRPLWDVAHSMHSNGTTSFSTDVDGLHQRAYAEALRENAAQVGGCTLLAFAADWLWGPVVLGMVQLGVHACCRCTHTSTHMQRTEERPCR